MLGESIVLVITPSPHMTIKIQQALDDIGGYKVITCNMPVEALELAQNSALDTCLLDIFHPDFPVLTVVKELKNKQPEMRIVLILSNHGLTHQDIPGIIPDGFLPRTFTTGQLLSALGQAPRKTKTTETSGLQPGHNIPDSPNEQSYQDSDLHYSPPFSTSA
jgi:DNA-binding NtrC family response regulator